MYLGKPVITTATEGPSRLVEDAVTGYIVPVGDSRRLGERLLYVLSNPKSAEQMGGKARSRVDRCFPPGVMLDDFWKALRRMELEERMFQ
jgi:N,N'-diacetylbacillosaminyl-diphospho-undecaprenol alpha-1,3-N-acetylgalactosaminyltransferase